MDNLMFLIFKYAYTALPFVGTALFVLSVLKIVFKIESLDSFFNFFLLSHLILLGMCLVSILANGLFILTEIHTKQKESLDELRMTRQGVFHLVGRGMKEGRIND